MQKVFAVIAAAGHAAAIKIHSDTSNQENGHDVSNRELPPLPVKPDHMLTPEQRAKRRAEIEKKTLADAEKKSRTADAEEKARTEENGNNRILPGPKSILKHSTREALQESSVEENNKLNASKNYSKRNRGLYALKMNIGTYLGSNPKGSCQDYCKHAKIDWTKDIENAFETVLQEEAMRKRMQREKHQSYLDNFFPEIFEEESYHNQNEHVQDAVSQALQDDSSVTGNFQVYGTPLLTARVGRTKSTSKYATWELPSVDISQKELKAKFEK